ncbi:hypothetical protein PCASD_25133 [Puccinia coronata f. sp. avenae]|uniref:Uncharacterized protein n=1 Tax=Puccinia coronata f. sp. avenae TaxID=200324 RepID=A0A2N5S261_9BASI|nr:hypothetical protein PCASD_25133 [Puccinia coronata f. sp. avenae]
MSTPNLLAEKSEMCAALRRPKREDCCWARGQTETSTSYTIQHVSTVTVGSSPAIHIPFQRDDLARRRCRTRRQHVLFSSSSFKGELQIWTGSSHQIENFALTIKLAFD